MFYRSDITENPKLISIADPSIGVSSAAKKEVEHLVRLLVANNQHHQPPLLSESFVIAIQGGWGTGKTWTSWQLINHLKKQPLFDDAHKLHIFAFELLPFTNIHESVGNILGSIAHTLHAQKIADVRKELRHMAIDALPDSEVTASMRFLGFIISRKFLVDARYKENKAALRTKFRVLSKAGHRFIVMLDDLDRMKPDEVLIVIRLVENFKDIPGIIFILPFHRNAVAHAIGEALKLDEASSHVFLRKFIKASITIQLSLEHLKKAFIRNFHHADQHFSAHKLICQHFGMPLEELIWYVLLHCILVRDTIAAIGADPSLATVQAHYNNYKASTYLFLLPNQLHTSRQVPLNSAVNPLPYASGGHWKRFADVFDGLAEGNDASTVVWQLQELMNDASLVRSISTNPEIIKALRYDSETTYDPTQSNPAHPMSTVFEAILLPHLQKTTFEPKVTDVYSLRDMEQLARAIENDMDFRITPEPTNFLQKLIAIVRERFLEFR